MKCLAQVNCPCGWAERLEAALGSSFVITELYYQFIMFHGPKKSDFDDPLVSLVYLSSLQPFCV